MTAEKRKRSDYAKMLKQYTTPSRMKLPEGQYTCTTARLFDTKRRLESSNTKITAATAAASTNGWKFLPSSTMWKNGSPRVGHWTQALEKHLNPESSIEGR